MPANRRHTTFLARAGALLGLTLLLALLAPHAATRAQTQFQGPVCAVPPVPQENDGWPKAVTDSIGTTVGPKTFAGATLLANDSGATSLTLLAVGPQSSQGGTITQASPGFYTYSPLPTFAGDDVFTYQIADTKGQTTIGIVHVNVGADTVAPSVNITSPIGGATVSGVVTISAAASDNVGVAGVKFFDGTSQIGAEIVAPPFSTSWDTKLVADGSHSLTAVARDAAGNSATSAAVAVNVSNAAPVVAVPTIQANVFSDGAGTRTTPAFSTTAAGEVLIALAASDGPTPSEGPNNQFLTISGAGLTWTRVVRAAVQRGVAEIWTATAPTVLTNVTVTSTQSVTAVLGAAPNQSLQVLAFTGAGGIGASSIASAASGAPKVSLITQQAGSAVVGVGIDFDQAIARTVGAGQTKLHEFLAPSGDTMWMQRLNGTTGAAGSTVTLSDTAPTADQWNFGAVEILSGAPPATVLVPSVVGKTEADARAAITAANLAVGTVTNASSSTVPAGQVISQNPAGGSSAVAGSAVSFVVSLGPAPAPAGGLVLALGFNEASGTTALDSSGSGLNGTIREAVRVPGKFGGALSFDGVNDWVTVLDTTASPLDLTTGMTIEAWVNPAAMSGWETAVLKERGVGLLSYALYANDGAPLAGGVAAPAGYVRAGGVDQPVRGTSPLPTGTWTHIATTYDGVNQNFYVNGVLVATRAQSGPMAVGNGALRIGGNASFTGEFFEGLIDEVRVYNRALTADEIVRDMNTPVQ